MACTNDMSEKRAEVIAAIHRFSRTDSQLAEFLAEAFKAGALRHEADVALAGLWLRRKMGTLAQLVEYTRHVYAQIAHPCDPVLPDTDLAAPLGLAS